MLQEPKASKEKVSQPDTEFQVNTVSTVGNTGWKNSATAALNDGGFVVVWHDDTSPRKIHGQRYDSAGKRVRLERELVRSFRLTQTPSVIGSQRLPR